MVCCSFAKGLGGNACCRFAVHIGTPRTHCTRRRAHVARPMGMHTVVDRAETCGRGASGVWRPMGEQRASWKGGRTRVAAAALSEVWSGGSARDQRHVLACSAFRLPAAATVGVCACVGAGNVPVHTDPHDLGIREHTTRGRYSSRGNGGRAARRLHLTRPRRRNNAPLELRLL